MSYAAEASLARWMYAVIRLRLFWLDPALVIGEGMFEDGREVSTRLLASSTSDGLTAGCWRVEPPEAALADAGGFDGAALRALSDAANAIPPMGRRYRERTPISRGSAMGRGSIANPVLGVKAQEFRLLRQFSLAWNATAWTSMGRGALRAPTMLSLCQHIVAAEHIAWLHWISLRLAST
jgi:hypothetical protein